MSRARALELRPGWPDAKVNRAIAVARAARTRQVGGDMGECMDLEATHHVHTGLTDDHRQATRAFVEKRTPVFKGR